MSGTFIKVNPTQLYTGFDPADYGFSSGDIVSIRIVGDFQAAVSGPYATDTNVDDLGVEFHGNIPALSADPSLFFVSAGDPGQIVNIDPIIGDNSDPDNDYGVMIEAVLTE